MPLIFAAGAFTASAQIHPAPRPYCVTMPVSMDMEFLTGFGDVCIPIEPCRPAACLQWQGANMGQHQPIDGCAQGMPTCGADAV